MRKLSEINKMAKDIKALELDVYSKEDGSSQALILFDGVLDSKRLLQSYEIEALSNHFYGNAIISAANTTMLDELHSLLTDLCDKGFRSSDGGTMIYPVKAKFDDLVVKKHSEEYSGPVNVVITKTDSLEHNILVLTCHWGNNLFRNDYYVVGVIGDTEDIEQLIEQI